MSTISASGVGQSILQYLQQFSTANQATTVNAPTTTTTDPTAVLTSSSSGTTQTSGHHHHHRGGDFQKIQDAVTSALQSAQSSGDTTDPNKIIQSAIEQVLGGTNSAAATGASGTTATTTATPQPSSAQTTFMQTLQSFGVDPAQFQNDFAAAVQDAQGGQVNMSSIFQSFGTGSVLDTTG